MRRKCGVASLQHDPEMYTSFMKTQAMTPSLKRFAEKPPSSHSASPAEKALAKNDSLNLTQDGFNKSSEESRHSFAESRQHTETLATESHSSDNQSDSVGNSSESSELLHRSSNEDGDEGITNFGFNIEDDRSFESTRVIKEKQS
jgi:hypothetical protein